MKKARSKKLNIQESVFYSPAKGTSKVSIYIGLFLRTLLLYIGTLGLVSLITGAIGLEYKGWWGAIAIGAGTVALLSIPVAIASGIASINKQTAIITPFAYVGVYMGIIAIAFGNPITATYLGALRVYNYALYHLSSYGYMSVGNLMVNDGYDYSTASSATSDPYRYIGVFLLCTLFGIVLHFTVQRKALIVPTGLLCALVFAPVLTYNIAYGTVGFSFTIAFIFGVIALKVYDYRYGGSAEAKQNRAKLRIKQKLEKAKLQTEKRDEKKRIKNEAERIYDAAIEEELTVKEAKKAKKAFLSENKKKLKLQRKEEREKKKSDKSRAKLAKKENKAKVKALKKEAKSAKKDKEKLAEIKNSILTVKNTEKEQKNAEKERLVVLEKEARRVRHCGGYAAMGAAVVAFLAILIPMTSVRSNFAVIEPINNRVQIVRTYVTAMLKGDDVDLNELYAYGIDDLTPRKLTFDPIVYPDDRKLFRVETETKHNVYLRSWIATDFDQKEGEWTSADYDTVLEFRERFGSAFTPDELTTNFNRYVFPSSTDITDAHTYKNFAPYGFVEEQVNVWRVSGNSLLLFTPSHINTDLGLTEYRGLGNPEYKYSKYFDGVYSSRFFKYGHGYGSVAFVPTYNRTDVGDGISDSIKYYKACREIIREYKDETDEEVIDALVYQLDSTLAENDVKYTGSSIVERYFYEYTDAEKKALLDYFDKEEDYHAYAVEKYTTPVTLETMSLLADDIQANAASKLSDGEELSTYDIIKSITSFFKENFKYTLEPDKSKYNVNKTVLEEFYTNVKEGSSSHFATTAVQIFRTLGIPARYVEGLCSSDFIETGSATTPYYSEVYLKNSHAWVEVYEEGAGWVMYEVTPNSYMEDIYDPNAATITVDQLNGEDDTTSDPFPDDKHETMEEIIDRLGLTEKEEEESDVEWFLARIIPFLIVVAVLTLLFFIGKYFFDKAQKVVDERFHIIDRARNEHVFNDKDNDREELIKKVNDILLETLETLGTAPKDGETPTEFGARMYNEHPEWSNIDPREVFAAMEKSEFGHGLNYEETYKCGEYTSDVITNVYKDLPFFEKIKLRYLKRKI